MKTVLQIGLVLCLAVTFGAALSIRSSAQIIYDCTNMYDRDTGCPKWNDMESCLLKKVDLNANDFSGATWTASMQYVRREIKTCPGLNFDTKGTCIRHIREECMKGTRQLYDVRDNTICDVLDEAKQCLNDANKNCIKNMVGLEMEELNDLEAECDAGHWTNGSCSPAAIRKCTEDIMFRRTPGDLSGMLFHCTKDLTAKAKDCMVDLKAKCTTKYQKQDIKKIWDYVKLVCPTFDP